MLQAVQAHPALIRGANSSDVPIDVDRRTAMALNLALPPAVLLRADRVIN